MADYYRDVIRLLRETPDTSSSGKDAAIHEIWWNPRTGVRVTVDRKLKSKFTANGILKEAGLSKAF